MAKALRGDAVVPLPRASNNDGHEDLRVAQRVKSFQRTSFECRTNLVPIVE